MNFIYDTRRFRKTATLSIGLIALMMAFVIACGAEPETIVVEKEVIKEVPVEKIVTQEVVKTVEVPGETVVKEVVKTVEVPGQTVVKEVVKEVPVEKIVTQEVVKTVEVEVPVEVIKEVVQDR